LPSREAIGALEAWQMARRRLAPASDWKQYDARVKTRNAIVRCTLLSRPRCPRSWDALAPTESEDVRRCGACGDDVYLVRTDEETIAHAELGHCVARERPDASELPQRSMVMGRPNIVIRDPTPTPEQERAAAWTGRERGIAMALLPSSMLSGNRCAACGYPTPTFTEHCYVCGEATG
jgi:hypothetical protein